MLHLLKRIRCHVCVDGMELEEFKTETKGNDLRCFIAAEEGKEYVVTVRNNAYKLTDDDTLVADLYVDGLALNAAVIPFHQEIKLMGKRDVHGSMQPLSFGRLITKEADSSRPPHLPDLSTIAVVVRRVKIIGTAPNVHTYAPRFDKIESVDERTAKQSEVLRDRITSSPVLQFIPQNCSINSEKLAKEIEERSQKEVLEAYGTIPLPEIAKAADDEHLLQDVKQEGLRRSKRLRGKREGPQAEDKPDHPADVNMDDHNPESKDEQSHSPRKRPLMDVGSASDRSCSNSDSDTKPCPTNSSRPARKTRKLKPDFGTMIDLEADGGPVETQFPIEKKEAEVIDLFEDGDDDAGVPREEGIGASGEKQGYRMDEGGYFVPVAGGAN
ncbi:hypothetical protein HK097_002176 [Rhizophlyctis rosea]|uniref:DUF7918 domain-containing protein n=1 Tax=Rhizophlyctis rosea TaxID=64517 RepID=A0AAD5X3A9_9FUNG|nr:hypothetical protein HK097_002176 [Rhizophlyctis rosea]